MNLTNDQKESVDFLVDAILKKKKIVGFMAPGGCGKTFSMKRLSTDERLKEYNVTFTATTNKAVSVMKKEGIENVSTLHSAVSIHIPTRPFAELIAAYDLKKKEGVASKLTPLCAEMLKSFRVKPDDIYAYSNEKELLAENGIDGFDDRVFSHYSTGNYVGGAISIDEASTLPAKSQYDDGKLKVIGLDIVAKIYDTVILSGDDSQLPPISGKSCLEDIEKTTLTENMRAGDGLLKFLDYVRKGGNVSNYIPKKDEPVLIVASAMSCFYDRDKLIENDVAHIVYRNKTRKEITKRVRRGLTSVPLKGEPIVYRGASIDTPDSRICKNETGVFNGFVGEWEDHKQSVQGRHFDEYADGFAYLQYGYAMTAHTAQGSSYGNVVVYVDDIPSFIDKETKRKWVYTASSRARKSITIIY